MGTQENTGHKNTTNQTPIVRYTMDCRKLTVLLLVAAVNCKVIDLEGREVVNGESMVEVVQRLVREVNMLKTDNQKFKADNEKLIADDLKLKTETDELKTDTQKLKTDYDRLKTDALQLKTDNEKLKVDSQKLKSDSEKLKMDSQKIKADNEKLKVETKKLEANEAKLKVDSDRLKAEVSRLKNNGYSQFSVADQQWQSLHMAAAAACRASTALGGHGPLGNRVFPRTSGKTCNQVCDGTKYYTECDASVSILGFMGRVKVAGSPAGSFYNYHCNSPGWSGLQHEEGVADAVLMQTDSYFGYCCCRKP